jgi:hypothetical protein
MLFFHFVFKAFPFETDAGKDAQAMTTDFIFNFEKSTKNRHNVKVNPSFLHMLASMMQYKPEERATIDQVLECEWVKSNLLQLSTDRQA